METEKVATVDSGLSKQVHQHTFMSEGRHNTWPLCIGGLYRELLVTIKTDLTAL